LTYLKNYKGWLLHSIVESSWSLHSLVYLSRSVSQGDRLIAAKAPNSSPEIFNRLCRDESEEIRIAVASNPNASPESLEYLYNNQELQSWKIIRAAITNPNMPHRILRQIIIEPDKLSGILAYQEWALINPNLPSDLIDEIAHHGAPVLNKIFAARHPNASEDALALLSLHEGPLIRIAVIKNPNVPSKILSRLSKDSHAAVRAEVASLPNAPIETLVVLKHDENEEVRERAFNTLQYLVSNDRSLENKIEELESLLDLGIRGDVDPLNLDDIDI